MALGIRQMCSILFSSLPYVKDVLKNSIPIGMALVGFFFAVVKVISTKEEASKLYTAHVTKHAMKYFSTEKSLKMHHHF